MFSTLLSTAISASVISLNPAVSAIWELSAMSLFMVASNLEMWRVLEMRDTRDATHLDAGGVTSRWQSLYLELRAYGGLRGASFNFLVFYILM
jgi:hypothetical protein